MATVCGMGSKGSRVRVDDGSMWQQIWGESSKLGEGSREWQNSSRTNGVDWKPRGSNGHEAACAMNSVTVKGDVLNLCVDIKKL